MIGVWSIVGRCHVSQISAESPPLSLHFSIPCDCVVFHTWEDKLYRWRYTENGGKIEEIAEDISKVKWTFDVIGNRSLLSMPLCRIEVSGRFDPGPSILSDGYVTADIRQGKEIHPEYQHRLLLQ